jgi:hypothetical protein
VRVVVADALFVNLEEAGAGKILGETEWYRISEYSANYRSSERGLLKEEVTKLEGLVLQEP